MNDALHGRKVLVLEDEYYLADDVRRGLNDAGAVVLGPAASLAAGLRLIEETLPDLAVLDVNLRGIDVYEIAEALIARGVPFVFATGYDEARMPERFDGVHKFLKPYDIPALIGALRNLAAPV